MPEHWQRFKGSMIFGATGSGGARYRCVVVCLRHGSVTRVFRVRVVTKVKPKNAQANNLHLGSSVGRASDFGQSVAGSTPAPDHP